jgi:hypothetical protein
VSGDVVDQDQVKFLFGEEFLGAFEDSLAQEGGGWPPAGVFAANRSGQRLSSSTQARKPALFEFVIGIERSVLGGTFLKYGLASPQ